MFLTRECDYAIRVVRGLADMEMKSVGILCEREDIPQPFAYKILKKLEREGVVTAHRGNTGGYQLAKMPDDVTLLDIVQAVDKQLFLHDCLRENHTCSRNSDDSRCEVHQELARIQGILMDELNKKKMKELI